MVFDLLVQFSLTLSKFKRKQMISLFLSCSRSLFFSRSATRILLEAKNPRRRLCFNARSWYFDSHFNKMMLSQLKDSLQSPTPTFFLSVAFSLLLSLAHTRTTQHLNLFCSLRQLLLLIFSSLSTIQLYVKMKQLSWQDIYILMYVVIKIGYFRANRTANVTTTIRRSLYIYMYTYVCATTYYIYA